MASSSEQQTPVGGFDATTPNPVASLRWRKTKPSFASLDLVTFHVGAGENAEKFVVHKDFVCYYSEVFAKAFASAFIEGDTQTYTIDDVDTEVFQMFITWIYQQNLEHCWKSTHDLEGFGASDSNGLVGFARPDVRLMFNTVTLNLVKLWILADRYLVARLGDQILGELYKYTIHNLPTSHRKCKEKDGCWEDASWVPYVYANTDVGSPLRDFAVQYCQSVPAHNSGNADNFFSDHPEYFPHEFLLELAKAQAYVLHKEKKKYKKYQKRMEIYENMTKPGYETDKTDDTDDSFVKKQAPSDSESD